jgi:cytidine deaminase
MVGQIDWAALEQSAWAARAGAYARYSNFSVGAAVLTDSGGIFSGANIENVSFSLTICAERAAIIAAVHSSACRLAALLIVADVPMPIAPCGACRQFAAEFADELPIRSVTLSGVRHSWKLSELLPEPFTKFS